MDIYNVTLNSMRPCSRVEERQEVLTFAELPDSVGVEAGSTSPLLHLLLVGFVPGIGRRFLACGRLS